jgi:Fe-S cluster assembly protein SufD
MSSAFTPDAAAALDGPGWLRDRRRAAAERAAAAGMPSTDEEVWRYSRIDELELDAFAPAAAPASTDVPALAAGFVAAVPAATVVITVDGHVVRNDGTAGVTGLDLVDVAAGAGDGDPLGGTEREAPDVFATLNHAFAPAPLLLRVAAGTVIDQPIVVVHHASGTGAATFPRLALDVGADAQVTVVEVQLSADGPGLVCPITEITVGRDARATYVGLQQLAFTTWQVGSMLATVDQGATFRSVAAGFGGDYARLRTDCRLVGRGAHGDLDAVYFGEGTQMLDFRTFQDHVAPDTTSNLLFKGAVGGSSRSVYTGLIRVGKEARGTNAFQTNRNIKLSDHAWAESVPNLVIENNDVRCSHASTVGPVAQEERFYLESRGVPTDVAERLIVSGFFDEVLQHVPVDELRPGLEATIAAKFERRQG